VNLKVTSDHSFTDSWNFLRHRDQVQIDAADYYDWLLAGHCSSPAIRDKDPACHKQRSLSSDKDFARQIRRAALWLDSLKKSSFHAAPLPRPSSIF
jgi:hypothetical protein